MGERRDALVSVARAKEILDLGDGEETRLGTLIAVASQLVRNVCRRYFLREVYTETRDGPQLGSSLLTREFPLLSVTSLYDSWDRSYSAEHLIPSSDYVFYEFGRIRLLNRRFATGVQNLRLSYEAGFEVLQVIPGVNDRIDFLEAEEGEEKSAVLTSGDYTPEELADEVEAQLTEAGEATYTVNYSSVSQQFTLISDGAFFSLLWSSGTYSARSAARVLGFAEVDATGAVSYSSTSRIVSVPEALQAGVARWAGYLLDGLSPGEELESETLGDYSYKRGKREGAPEGVMDLIGEFVSVVRE